MLATNAATRPPGVRACTARFARAALAQNVVVRMSATINAGTITRAAALARA
jgi:hypothetical protein